MMRRLLVFALTVTATAAAFPATVTAHSGGLDAYGCHAGSQPYHCHGGGTGSGGSGGSDSGYDPPPVDPGPTASQLAAISRAESALAKAKSSHTANVNKAKSLRKQHQRAKAKLDVEQGRLDTLEAQAKDAREEAEALRAELVSERQAAVSRVEKLDKKYAAALVTYDDARLFSAWLGGMFGAFLLVRFARPFAARFSTKRGWWLLGFSAVGVSLLGYAQEASSFAVGVIVAIIGGVIFGFVWMLASLWWLPFSVPKVLSRVLLGLSVLLAIGLVGSVSTTEKPTKSKPSSDDLALVADAKRDPDGKDQAEAKKLDEKADDLDKKVAAKENVVSAADAEVLTLKNELATANADAQTDAQAMRKAKIDLDAAKMAAGV